MSDEKKIAKYERHIKAWLIELENTFSKLEKTEDPKKKEKLEKKIARNKDDLKFCVETLINLGGKIEAIEAVIPDSQKVVLKTLYLRNSEQDRVKVEKEIARIKKMLHKLKEMAKEESYGRGDDIEMKMKNKLFREEAFVGYRLNRAGEKIRLSGEPNAGYNDYWNYARDYESTKDQYFTQEEQQLIQKCLESRQEEKAYLVEKRAWLGRLGSGLLDTAEKMDAWGDLAQAKFWVRNLYQDACPVIIREMYGKLPKAEEEQKSKEMTRRYLEFLRSEEQIAELNRIYEDTEKEAEELKMKLKTFSFQNDDFLSKKNDREIQELIRIMEQDVDGQNLLVLYLLRERIGMEKTAFISQYKYDPILNTRKELLNKFSIEELGL